MNEKESDFFSMLFGSQWDEWDEIDGAISVPIAVKEDYLKREKKLLSLAKDRLVTGIRKNFHIDLASIKDSIYAIPIKETEVYDSKFIKKHLKKIGRKVFEPILQAAQSCEISAEEARQLIRPYLKKYADHLYIFFEGEFADTPAKKQAEIGIAVLRETYGCLKHGKSYPKRCMSFLWDDMLMPYANAAMLEIAPSYDDCRITVKKQGETVHLLNPATTLARFAACALADEWMEDIREKSVSLENCLTWQELQVRAAIGKPLSFYGYQSLCNLLTVQRPSIIYRFSDIQALPETERAGIKRSVKLMSEFGSVGFSTDPRFRIRHVLYRNQGNLEVYIDGVTFDILERYVAEGFIRTLDTAKYITDFISMDAETIFTLLHMERYGMIAEYTELEKNAREHAKAFQTKKNIPEQTMSLMEKSTLNKYYGFVEYDQSSDPVKIASVEKEIQAFLGLLPIDMQKMSEYQIRFRHIGNHHAAGLYYPGHNCMVVSMVYPSSYIHELGHLIDYRYGNLSHQRSFNSVYAQYEHNFRSALKGEKLKGKYDENYYLLRTEVFARCFEIYWKKVRGIDNSIIGSLTGMDYPLTENLQRLVESYFNRLLGVTTAEEKAG